MDITIALVVGLLLGIIGATTLLRLKSNGYLRIDRSIPEDGPRLFLELTESVESITKKKYVTIAIKNENYLSR